MPQHTAGTATGPGATDAFMQAIDTALLGNGWTALDRISSTVGARDCVYKGGPLDTVSGSAPIIRVTQNGTASLYMTGYAGWDTTAHAGWCPVGGSSWSYINLQDATFTYWIQCTPLAITLFAKIATSYNSLYGGFVRRGRHAKEAGIAKSTGPIAAATTNVPVTADMTASLQPGQWVHIYNNTTSNASANKQNFERIQISAVTGGASPSITFATGTAHAYDSGALIGWNPFPNGTTQGGSPSSFPTFLACFWLDGSGYSGISSQSYGPLAVYPSGATNNSGPEENSTEYILGWYTLYSSSAGKRSLFGIPYHWYVVSNYITAPAEEDLLVGLDHSYRILGSGTNAIGPTDL